MEITSAVEAAARSANVGKAARNCSYFGNTLCTCVCCSIISETSIAYGSWVKRQGRSRCSAAYHCNRLALTRVNCSVSGFKEKYDEREGLAIFPQDLAACVAVSSVCSGMPALTLLF